MKNKSGEIVEIVGRKIVSGEFKENETIPKMEVLAEMFQVSRTVIREALKELSRMGIVESVQKSGTIVLEKSEWYWWDQQLLQWIIEDINDSGHNHLILLLHLNEIRLALEPMAIYLATKRATSEDLEHIHKCLMKLEQSINDSNQWAIADYKFHLSLVKASHNYLMINILTKLNKVLILSRKKTYGKLGSKKEFSKNLFLGYQKHFDIYKAMVEKDADKAKLIAEELISEVYELISKEINE